MTDEPIDSELKQELRFLRQRLYWLCWSWEDYKTLFGEEENVEILERTTGSLSSILRSALLDSIQLDIRALSEPDKTGSNTNLSLHRLIHWGESQGCDSGSLDEIRGKLEEAQHESERLKDRRNKLIAHFDLNAITSEDPRLINWPTDEEIGKSITNLEKAMNLGENLLGECIFDYDSSNDEFRTGATSLLAILRRHEAKTGDDPLALPE